MTTREARLVAKINAARANHGLPALRTSPDLMAAARAHTRRHGRLSGCLFHTTSFSTDLLLVVGRRERRRRGYTVRGVHRSLMRSAPHRANILNRRMREVGVGVVSAGGRIWVTEVFRQPTGSPPSVS